MNYAQKLHCAITVNITHKDIYCKECLNILLVLIKGNILHKIIYKCHI